MSGRYNYQGGRMFAQNILDDLDKRLKALEPQPNVQDKMLQLEVLLANYHSVVWNACQDGEDYDLSGKAEAKVILFHVRSMLLEALQR